MTFRISIWLVAMVLLLPSLGQAYSIVYDYGAFAQKYTTPSVHIDFDSPTHFTGSSGSGYQTVYDDAFSPKWKFQSDTGRYGGHWTAVRWNGTGIYSDSPISIYLDILITGASEPFSLLTNLGFLGIIPDENETFLRLGGAGVTYISDLKSGYSPTPLPSAIWLLSTAFLGLVFVEKRKYKSALRS